MLLWQKNSGIFWNNKLYFNRRHMCWENIFLSLFESLQHILFCFLLHLMLFCFLNILLDFFVFQCNVISQTVCILDLSCSNIFQLFRWFNLAFSLKIYFFF